MTRSKSAVLLGCDLLVADEKSDRENTDDTPLEEATRPSSAKNALNRTQKSGQDRSTRSPRKKVQKNSRVCLAVSLHFEVVTVHVFQPELATNISFS